MRRSMIAAAFLVACSSDGPDKTGLRATGVSCDVTGRVCCEQDSALAPTCIDGVWYCAENHPNFWPREQCIGYQGTCSGNAPIDCTSGAPARACADTGTGTPPRMPGDPCPFDAGAVDAADAADSG
jgi:hypothetical protein